MIWACTWICSTNFVVIILWHCSDKTWPEVFFCSTLALFSTWSLGFLLLFYSICNILYLLVGFIWAVLILWHCFDLTIWVIVFHLPLFSTCFLEWLLLLLFYLLSFCKKLPYTWVYFCCFCLCPAFCTWHLGSAGLEVESSECSSSPCCKVSRNWWW